jgi:hypothetical protein
MSTAPEEVGGASVERDRNVRVAQAVANFERQRVEVEHYPKTFGIIIMKIWTDPAFEKQFYEDPAGVMREHGIPIPPGTVLRADALMVPSRPRGLDDEILGAERVQGSCLGSASSFSCPGCTAGSAGSGLC